MVHKIAHFGTQSLKTWCKTHAISGHLVPFIIAPCPTLVNRKSQKNYSCQKMATTSTPQTKQRDRGVEKVKSKTGELQCIVKQSRGTEAGKSTTFQINSNLSTEKSASGEPIFSVGIAKLGETGRRGEGDKQN